MLCGVRWILLQYQLLSAGSTALNPALENADITAAFSTACDNMTTHLLLCVCESVCMCDEVQACLRSVKLCWEWPLPSRPPVEGPGGRSALRDRVHGHFLCCVGVTEKKRKHQALPPEACRCCQRAEPVLYITKPNIVTLILSLYHPAAPRVADFVDARFRYKSFLCRWYPLDWYRSSGLTEQEHAGFTLDLQCVQRTLNLNWWQSLRVCLL